MDVLRHLTRRGRPCRSPPRTPAGTGILALALCFAPLDSDAAEASWEGGITAIYQDSDDSRTEAELTASADLFVTLPHGRGEWLLYIEGSSSPSSDGVSAFYPTANGDAHSVLTAGGDGSVQISELNYTFFLSDDRSLMVGLIDPSSWLDRGRIANDENTHFVNGSFVHNTTIEFPDYTLGGVFRVLGNGIRPEITVVLAGSDGIADLPERSYQDLLDLNAAGRGVFVGAGTSWLFEHFSWRVGAWLRNDDHPVAGNVMETENNYGAYGVFGWQSGANAVNIRAGIANQDVSIADRFLAAAYQRRTRTGLFGVGIAVTGIAGNFSASGRERAVDSEVYFRIPILNGSGHLTPSIQYVEVPEIDAIPGPTSSAVVAGVRFHWSF